MSTFVINLKPIVAAIFAIVTYSLPLQAFASDIGALLERLKTADSAEAAKISREIQMDWSKSGSPTMDLLLKRARAALESEDFGAAIEHFTALTDHAPEFAEGWHGRATAYFRVGKLGPALADLEKTLALNPHHYGAIYGLAVIFEQLKKYDEAYDAYSAVLAIHPHHEDVATALERLEPLVNGVKL